VKKLGILYNPKLSAALPLARELEAEMRAARAEVWVCSSWEEEMARQQISGTELVFSVGGDGTVLRSARIVAPWPIPILGVNLGRLGFMTELGAEEVRDRLPQVLAGEGWVEARARLGVELLGGRPQELPSALNDVMVGRGATPRVVSIETIIDGQPLTTFVADGLIVATPTGSTAYTLAAGGPIVHPSVEAILLQPLAVHINLKAPLLLPADAVVELLIHSEHSAVLSVDGQVNIEVSSGDRIRVKRSPHHTRFLRLHPPGSYYGRLAQRLCLGQ